MSGKAPSENSLHRRSSTEPTELTLPGGFGSVVRALMIILALAAVLTLLRGRLASFMSPHLVSGRVQEIAASLQRKDWALATQQLRKLREVDAKSPAVLRVTTTFLDETGAEPQLQLQTLDALKAAGQEHERDGLLRARAQLRLGNLGAARAALETLPAPLRESSEGLSLKAAIFAQEGHNRQAETVQQLSEQRASGSEDSALRRALVALRSPIPETRASALGEVWHISAGKDLPALEALRVLVARSDLIEADARKLYEAIHAHPLHEEGDRLAAVSTLMRVVPAMRQTLLDQETAPNSNRSLNDLVLLSRWLATEREHERLVALVPRAEVLRSSELFPILLQSLANTGRWQEMQRLFNQSQSLAMPEEGLLVWKAYAAGKLQPTGSDAARWLRLAITGSLSSKNFSTLRAAAKAAEDLEQWQLAFEAYQALSEVPTGLELEMLDKCWEIAAMLGEEAWKLETARRQYQLRPTSLHFANRFDYLRILLGNEMEAVALKDAPHSARVHEDAAERQLLALIEALKAYRLGNASELQLQLTHLQDVSSLTPGQRAVYAGLLATTGQVGRAFELAERLPVQTLAAQELSFLRKAL